MKSSPIYNRITNPGRKSDCSFGSSEGFSQSILVGTSAKNSHELGVVHVARLPRDDGTVKFNMYVDGVLVKSGVLDGKNFEIKEKDNA